MTNFKDLPCNPDSETKLDTGPSLSNTFPRSHKIPLCQTFAFSEIWEWNWRLFLFSGDEAGFLSIFEHLQVLSSSTCWFHSTHFEQLLGWIWRVHKRSFLLLTTFWTWRNIICQKTICLNWNLNNDFFLMIFDRIDDGVRFRLETKRSKIKIIVFQKDFRYMLNAQDSIEILQQYLWIILAESFFHPVNHSDFLCN